VQKYKLLITPLAEEDMGDCFDYICNNLHNPQAALGMMDEIEHYYDLLEDNPFMGEQYITEGGTPYRFLLVKRYKLFYRIVDDTILISRFLYAPSNYSSKLMD
jgi:plasmid stabilization system protein ParE